MIKGSISEFFFNVSRNFFQMHNLASSFPIYYMQNYVFFVFGATFAASNCQFISIFSCVFGEFKHPWLSGWCVRPKFGRSQIRIRHVAEFLLI